MKSGDGEQTGELESFNQLILQLYVCTVHWPFIYTPTSIFFQILQHFHVYFYQQIEKWYKNRLMEIQLLQY